MEEQKNVGRAEMCKCGWCRGNYCHGYSIFRILLALVAAMIVFWLGVKVGELKDEFEYRSGCRGYPDGYYMMRPGGVPYQGMMYNTYNGAQEPAGASTTSPVKQ